MNWLLHLKRIVFESVELFLLNWFVLNLLQRVLQSIFNLIFGPNRNDRESNRPLCYDVKMNFKTHYLQMNNVNFFLLKYRGTVDVSVIDQEDVILYDYTPDTFLYARIRSDVDYRDVTNYPFISLTSHDNAVQVISVPRQVVKDRLRRRKVTDGRNIVLLHSIPRCGSTLLTNIVHQTKQFQVYNEPWPIYKFGVETGRYSDAVPMDSSENLDLIRTLFLLLCKNDEDRYFVKQPASMSGQMFHIVHKALPQIKESFTYRALANAIPSFQQMSGLRYYLLSLIGFNLIPMKYRKMWEKVKILGVNKRIAFLFLCQMHPEYLECQAGRNIRAYAFESIVRNKKAFCQDFLSFLDLDQDLLPLALSGFDADSQENCGFAKKIIQAYPKIVLSDDDRTWVRSVALKMFGMELRQEDLFATNVPNIRELEKLNRKI